MNIFEKINDAINGVEGSVVNLLTALAPWISPLAPAVMTYQHMIGFLHFNQAISFLVAGLVEILGFGTVSTGLDFWFYNRRERAEYKKAPFWLIVAIFGFYLALILVTNVVIDISVSFLSTDYQKWAIIIVRALLTLQTIPGALIVAARTSHRDLLADIKRSKEESSKKSTGTSGNTSETIITSRSTSRTGRPSIHQERVFSYIDEVYSRTNEVPTFTEVMRDLNLSQSTASRLRNEWLDNKNRNG